MGKPLARRRSHAALHDFPRRPSSRPNLYAGPSTRISAAQCLSTLGMGKTLERMRIHPSSLKKTLTAGDSLWVSLRSLRVFSAFSDAEEIRRLRRETQMRHSPLTASGSV